MAKILSFIGAHLCTAPRPQKEADLLSRLGHEVHVRGVWFDPALIERDNKLRESKPWSFEPVLNFEKTNLFSNLATRAKRRVSLELFKRYKTFSPELLGYGARQMLRTAQREKADLTIVHSEAGLWVGAQLIQQGFNVGVDFEDWFSEDLPEASRTGRPRKHIREYEKLLAQSCRYCLTTSHTMAQQMADAFQSTLPTVVYNTFPITDRDTLDGQFLDRKDRELPSLHWFSHTIGRGRGIEQLVAALPHVHHPAEIHLRGNYPESMKQWLESRLSAEWKDRLHIHPLVANDELLSRIAEHDIGLALESSDVLSRDLTVTNKLFQYMLAGIAVIATETTGQKEVLDSWASPKQLVPVNDPQALAQSINHLLSSQENLRAAKQASLLAAKEHYCWEKQIDSIKQTVDNALSLNRRTEGHA